MGFFRLNIHSDSSGYFVFGNISHLNQTYTFIETFDTSEDGVSGGLVQLIAGGIGSKEFQLSVKPVSADHHIFMYIVDAYAEDEKNGGQNFRHGRYLPGLERLSWQV